MAGEQRMPTQLVKGLGWFSIGLGLAEVVAPKAMASLIGVRHDSKTGKILRIYGAREIGAGIGVLSQSKASKWLWARFAGDLLDLSSLAKAMTSRRTRHTRAVAATAAVAGVTVADLACAVQLTRTRNERNSRREAAAITGSITIARTADEIYGFWRDFSRFPEIFERLERVQVIDSARSHWKLALTAGRNVEWDAEITDDQPNSRIAWHSLTSSVPHSGQVRFEPAAGQRGTKVTVKIQPGGIGATLGKLFGLLPEQHVNIALHNLKQLMETGEVVKSDASIHRGMHAARPPEEYPNADKGLSSAASA